MDHEPRPEVAALDRIKVLMVEDNPDDALIMRKLLSGAKAVDFVLTSADRLAVGFERLREDHFDVVLLDLTLPDSSGMDTLVRMHANHPELPIVVLTGLEDEKVGLRAVHEGAQDYLIKGGVDSFLLERSIHYAIERHRMAEQLRSLSLTDELTGLQNRRGFITISQQQLRNAKRSKKEMFVLFADLDGMKQINDRFGHKEGDAALVAVADVLSSTFRASDVVARMGGDEFAVLGMEASRVDAEELVERLRSNLAALNRNREAPYEISLSIGIVRCDPEALFSVDELLEQADELMYEQKKAKKS